MKILLVESDPAAIKAIKSILVKAEHELTIVNSAKAAIDVLTSGGFFDVILSALVMPGKDGFQLLKYLQSMPRFNKIPVLIVSSLHDRESVVRCIELGAKDYIIKPIDQKLLLTKVQHLLQFCIKSVMIVDKDPLIRNLLRKIVEREGYKAVTVESAEQALEQFDPDDIGLVISDIELEGMDGLELLKAIKEKDSHIPFFVITGRTNKYDKDAVMDAGADGYITKPFKNFEIARRVAVALT